MKLSATIRPYDPGSTLIPLTQMTETWVLVRSSLSDGSSG